MAEACVSDVFPGRIGRIVARNALENPEINIVAINEYAMRPTPIQLFN
jgi:glyceraldehyde-3-phosphate dehydrogenase/erythrose-4-phosphate dehydrogenase